MRSATALRQTIGILGLFVVAACSEPPAVQAPAPEAANVTVFEGARLITGGTDNHLVLIDVTAFGLTGRQAESALLDAGIVTNRNAVPADPNGAWYTSGVRIGTPALTTRGFGADEFDKVAELIVNVLREAIFGDQIGAGEETVHSESFGFLRGYITSSKLWTFSMISRASRAVRSCR